MTSRDRLEFKLKENWGKYKSWWIFLHSGFDLPDNDAWNGYEVNRHTFNMITWKLSSFRLLESPYQTNCKDYRVSGQYLSRTDCIRKCKIQVSVEMCGVIFKGIDLMRSDPNIWFGGNRDVTQKECFYNLSFTDICLKRCSHFDCSIDHYKVVVLLRTKETHKNFSKRFTLLKIQIPTEPEASYTHQPRMELVEFICYLASTFNMWFGFSMLSLYYFLTILRNRVKNKMIKKSEKAQDVLFDKMKISQKLDEEGSNKQVKIQSLKFSTRY